MSMDIEKDILDNTLEVLKKQLLQSRVHGHWQGQLSSSALATAVAVFALAKTDGNKHQLLIQRGLDWLSSNCNDDGGWGDTVLSLSNISTTMLCWSAFTVAEDPDRYKHTIANAQLWLVEHAGSLEPCFLVKAINQQYGKDRSFSAPILTMCVLSGKGGDKHNSWRQIKPLPFEIAALPHSFLKWIGLPVVSYALPALVAVGLVNFYHRRPANPITFFLRLMTRRKVLKVLQTIQPENGGFLEAVPLTSFVLMSLAASDQKENPVAYKACDFIIASVRDDGSWPIDTNLATWVSTLSINALATADDFENILITRDRKNIQEWLLSQQYHLSHPYTYAEPGGWAWTDMPGGVPDADDTAGALIALHNLGSIDNNILDSAVAGIKWLLGVQNRDGGIPTFCSGWTSLPFDRSAADITAHAINAMNTWLDLLPVPLQKDVNPAIRKALIYLAEAQEEDGSWIPLWFGNQFAPKQQNPIYGTSKVLIGLAGLSLRFADLCVPIQREAIGWLMSQQNCDGQWGGGNSTNSSIEETALAIDALASVLNRLAAEPDYSRQFNLPVSAMESAVSTGTSKLLEMVRKEVSITPSPIGLYFAKLWYFEKLYPYIFTISALQKVRNLYRTK